MARGKRLHVVRERVRLERGLFAGFLSGLSERYDICIFYARFIDDANRLLGGARPYYAVAARWARAVGERCGRVVVPDHGSKRSERTLHALWSC